MHSKVAVIYKQYPIQILKLAIMRSSVVLLERYCPYLTSHVKVQGCDYGVLHRMEHALLNFFLCSDQKRRPYRVCFDRKLSGTGGQGAQLLILAGVRDA